MAYLAFVATAAAIAVAERVYASRNEARLLAEGAVEVAPWVFRLMVPPYVLIFPAAVAEHLLAPRRLSTPLLVSMLLLFAASKALKVWAILHLGRAWTMKVIVPRDLRVVCTGPYRYLRHPNYVAVIGEILSLPLAGGAWATALVGGAIFAAVLSFRVRTEEAALGARPAYAAFMTGKRRFLPGRRRS
jgi:methyltransferase